MKKYYSIVAISLLIIGLLVIFGCASKELTSAKVYIQQDDWAKAEEQLKQAVAMYPNDAEAQALLGEAYSRRGEFEKMNEAFDASLAVSEAHLDRIKYVRDKNWVQNFNNGVAKVKTEELDEAMKHFETCKVIDPTRPDAHRNVAFVAMRSGDVELAKKNYREVLELDPKDTKVMLQLGALLYEEKKYEEAIDLMDKIIAIEPTNLEAISQKAFAFDSMGESEKAFEAYSSALEQNPDSPDLIFNLGRLYYMRDDFTSAIEQFKNVLNISPDDYEATLNIGNAYLSVAEEFMAPIREGAEMSDKEKKTTQDKAIEQYKAAVPFLKKAVEIKPDDSITWTNLGVAYINSGMKEEGEAAFKKADELSK